MPLLTFLDEGIPKLGIERQVASNLLMVMIKEAWFQFCKIRGLIEYSYSNSVGFHASKRTGLAMEAGDFGRRQKAKASLPLLAGVIDQSNEDIFNDVPDFHRRIKAEFLSIAPTQLVRETTLAPNAFLNKAGYPLRKTQDAATLVWNLATGLYYKTQPKPPWRLGTVRPGVCYIGMVYKSLPDDPDGHACCAAQMFLNEGDGVVFRGANGP